MILLVVAAGCMSDKGPNSDTPFEASRYPAMKSYLDSACAQFCVIFEDALAARFETDTANIPGLDWPYEMPTHGRTNPTNYVDANTSWGVNYDLTVDTTRYLAFWDLGRLVDTGVLIHTSPIPATRVEHSLIYGRQDGEGDNEVTWDGNLSVILTDLDSAVAGLSAVFVAKHQVGLECGNSICDDIQLTINDGEFTKVGDELSFATLSGTVQGTIKLTEFDVLLGYDAVFTWVVSGTITDGVANLTVSSGEFSQSETYSLCP